MASTATTTDQPGCVRCARCFPRQLPTCGTTVQWLWESFPGPHPAVTQPFSITLARWCSFSAVPSFLPSRFSSIASLDAVILWDTVTSFSTFFYPAAPCVRFMPPSLTTWAAGSCTHVCMAAVRLLSLRDSTGSLLLCACLLVSWWWGKLNKCLTWRPSPNNGLNVLGTICESIYVPSPSRQSALIERDLNIFHAVADNHRKT